MKLKKRLLSLLLAMVLVLGNLVLCDASAACCTKMTRIPVTVEGSIFGGSSSESIKTQVVYDSDLLIKSNNKKYNSIIAGLSALLSADVYYREKDLAKGTQNRVLVDGADPAQYDHTYLLKTLGFSEVEYLETFKAGTYEYDSNDSATLMMAHAKVQGRYDTFVFAIRGCFSQQEWLSVFDPGANSKDYSALTGIHPEWLKKTQNKGVSIAAERTRYFMKEFMKKYDDVSCKDIVLVTGHSRGGAIANLIGAELEKDKKVKSFTYTFNAPGVDTKAVAGKQKTIFNVVEQNDIFLDPLPFQAEHLYRYGRDIKFSGKESTLEQSFYTLTGRQMPNSLSSKEVTEYKKLFSKRFKNRTSLYKMHTITETFQDEAAARERYDACVNLIGSAGLGLTPFCSVSEVEKTKKGYQFDICYCDAAWLVCYAKTLAYGSSAHDAAVELFAKDSAGCKVADFYIAHAGQINAGHLLARTYLISQLAARSGMFH